nr:IS630 family transposase [Athalassotoga saccharophila]
MKNSSAARTRIHCVILWGKGYEWETIKDVLMISDVMIQEVIEKYKIFGADVLIENHYEGHNNKMTAQEEKAVIAFVRTHFVRNTRVVINWIKGHFGKVYTEQGMQEFLNAHGFVYKKPKGVPGKHPSVEVQKVIINELTGRIEECSGDEEKQIFFVDGSGFDHNVKIGYGWIEKGKEQFIKTNTGREKINVNGAYNPVNQKVICIEHEENVNQQSNIKLVDKIIENSFTDLWMRRKRKLFLVMDNAKYNHGKLFIEHLKQISKEKGIKIEEIYLPPYSPNLNLIERLWKYSKNVLLQVYYEKKEKFKSKIKEFFEEDVKDKLIKLELKTFIGTAFQIISG